MLPGLQSVSKEQAVDPTTPLDVDNLLSEGISEKTIDPVPDISPSEASAEPVVENNNVLSDELIFDDPDMVGKEPESDDLLDSATFHEPKDKQTMKEVEETLKKGPEPAIDLSEVIDFKQDKGGKSASKKVVETEKKAESKK